MCCYCCQVLVLIHTAVTLPKMYPIIISFAPTRPMGSLFVMRRKSQPNMMTSWNENIFRVTGPMCQFAGQRWIPLTKASDAEIQVDVLSDLRPNKRLCKQSRHWWFETTSRPLWRHCNDGYCYSSLKSIQRRRNAASATFQHPLRYLILRYHGIWE